MPWVDVDGVLTGDLLGSSPGEVMWNGKTLFVDPRRVADLLFLDRPPSCTSKAWFLPGRLKPYYV